MKQTLKKKIAFSLQEMIFDNSFQELDYSEKKSVVGGDPTPSQVLNLVTQLNNLFVQSSNCDSTHWNDFNVQVSLLAATNVGFDMLTKLVGSAAGRHITIIGIDPFPSNGGDFNGAEYKDNPSGGTIALGDLNFKNNRQTTDYDYTKQDALHFGTIAHELFHAFSFYTNNQQTYGNSVRGELDAFLFEVMADAEIDEKKNLTNSSADLLKSYSNWDNGFYSPNYDKPVESNLFQNAYYDMFHNKHFSLNNYNTILANMAGSSFGSAYTQSRLPIDSQTFDSSAIQDIFEFDYSQSSYFNNLPSYPFIAPAPVNVPSTPGGGGNGNTSGTFLDWYNTLINSGYSFYTVNTIYQVEDPGYGLGTTWGLPLGSSTVYDSTVYCTLADWFNAYVSEWGSTGSWNTDGYPASIS